MHAQVCRRPAGPLNHDVRHIIWRDKNLRACSTDRRSAHSTVPDWLLDVSEHFRGDTEAGRIQLEVDQIRGASEDDVTEPRFHPGLGGYQKVLLPRLPVGTQVTVDVSVAEFGFYRLGGDWIFLGERSLGWYSVAASALTMKSSNSSSLET